MGDEEIKSTNPEFWDSIKLGTRPEDLEKFRNNQRNNGSSWANGFMNLLGLGSTENSASSRAMDPSTGTNSIDYFNNLRDLGGGKFNRRSGDTTGNGEGSGSSMFDKFNMGGNIFRGLGEMAQGWAALQNVGVARDSQKFKEDAWGQNMARQKTTVNNPIRAQQALLKSDFYNDPARANSLKLVT